MVSTGRRAGGRRAALVLGLVALLGPATTATAAEPDGTVVGTVTGDGEGLANAWVTLTPVDSQGWATGQVQRTVTDGSGRYEFPGLPRGAVKVQVRAPLLGEFADAFWPEAFTFAGAGVLEVAAGTVTADVDLPVGGEVQGLLLDARTGAPIQGALVTATLDGDGSSGGLGTAGPVDGPGRFSLSGLPPVPLQLAVTLPGGSPYLAPSADRSGSSSALRIDGGARTTGVVIRLRRAAEIRGTVLDDAGAPVAGARVRLSGCLPACPTHATSDASGRYRLEAVAPGTGLGVVAVPGGGLLGPWYPNREGSARATDLRVGEGDVVDAPALTLTRAAFLTLTLADPPPDQPVRVVVRLVSTGTTYSQYFATSPSGGSGSGGAPGGAVRLRVGPVPPGAYSLSVTPGVTDIGHLPARWVTDSGIPTTPTIELAAGQEAEAVVRVTPAGAVREVDLGPLPGRLAGSPPDSPGAWPGLAQGFLAATGWIDPWGP